MSSCLTLVYLSAHSLECTVAIIVNISVEDYLE